MIKVHEVKLLTCWVSNRHIENYIYLYHKIETTKVNGILCADIELVIMTIQIIYTLTLLITFSLMYHNGV